MNHVTKCNHCQRYYSRQQYRTCPVCEHVKLIQAVLKKTYKPIKVAI